MTSGWLARLKQRKVFRVTAIYAVTGYAIFQVANNLLPALNVPRWTVTLFAALFVAGFPIVIGLSYAFDYTSEGLRLAPSRRGARPGARMGWFDWSLVTAAGVVFAFAAVQLGRSFRASSQPDTSAAAAPTSPVAVPPARSIAVLPFVSFSEGREGEFFTDGLTEELINSLAQLDELHVTGRTSAFYFKGRNEDLREIGRKLGVAHVLEGSARRSGQTLRVTAQLIKVSDGFHVWSQTFDQRDEDVFAVQTQIARAVAQALKVRLIDVGNEANRKRDPRAWQLELSARSRLRTLELADLQAAREQFTQLMRLEPRNARAYSGFAEASLQLAQGHLALDFAQARRESEAAVETALQLAPRDAQVWRVRGLLHRILAIRSGEQRDNAEALRSFQRAVEFDPHDADSLTMYAAQRLTQRQPEEAIALLRRSLAIDPLSRLTLHTLGTALASQGHLGEAVRQYESLIDLYPDYTNARVALGTLQLEHGRLDDAARTLDDASAIRADPLAGLLLAVCYANLGLDAEFARVVGGIREPPAALALARGVALLHQNRLAEFRRLIAAELAATLDPAWNSSLLLVAVMLDDRVEQRRLVADPAHSLRLDPPAADQFTPLDALIFAEALRRNGDSAQAQRIARAVLARNESGTGEYAAPKMHWARMLAAASLGDTRRALDELEAAEKAGFRTLRDDDYILRLESYPFMKDLAREARFIGAVQRIEAENRRMREHLLATRGERV